MAEMIPESLPSGKPKGERLVFDILQELPDDYLVYYEPEISERYPDFIVICPDRGVLVIEVKGWPVTSIIEATNEYIKTKDGEHVTSHTNPVKQARDYMFRVMDVCRKHSAFQELCHSEGQYEGRYLFPFGHVVFLSRIKSYQLQGSRLNRVFTGSRVVTRDVLDTWQNIGGEQVSHELGACFNPSWDFPRLTPRQIDIVRSAIHPDIVVSLPAQEKRAKDENLPPREKQANTVDILDWQQEMYARKIGDGHRVLNGVAGSGKTILLLHRARWLSEQDPDRRILVLCYNRALSSFLKSRLSDRKNVITSTFHSWGYSLKAKSNKNRQQFGLNVLEKLKNLSSKDKYDAILIDEAQDFEPSWFQCAVSALKDGEDGDLIVVADGNQGLYRPKTFRWVDVGVKAVGRVIPLRKNYRNTEEIMDLAWSFAEETEEDKGEAIVSIKPVKAVRNGPKPYLFCANDREEEIEKIVEVVSDLLAGRWRSEQLEEPLRPRDIGVIYPRISGKFMWAMFFALKERLEKLCHVVWMNDYKDKKAKDRFTEPGLKILTIDSSKGLQFRACILKWADLLPSNLPDSSRGEDRRKLYVGLTRAQDYLAVTYSDESEFTKDLENNWSLVFNV